MDTKPFLITTAVLASIELLPTVALQFKKPKDNFGTTRAGKLIRKLNNEYYSYNVSWLYFTLLTTGGALRIHRSDWATREVRAAAAMALLSLNVVLVILIMNLWNGVLMLSCRNPPLGLNRYEYFPEANGFEAPATFAAIRAEVNTYLDSRTVPCLHETVPDIRISSAVGEGGQCWRFLPLKKLGKLDEKHRTHFPALFDLLEQDCIANAIISSLDPGTVIPAHRGYFKGFIRYHLAIEAPTDAPASITCGGIRYEWKTGEGILFDDTFIHSVINPSRSRRTVLYLDIKRRNLPPYVQRMTDAVYAAVAGNKLLQAALADQHKTQSIDE